MGKKSRRESRRIAGRMESARRKRRQGFVERDHKRKATVELILGDWARNPVQAALDAETYASSLLAATSRVTEDDLEGAGAELVADLERYGAERAVGLLAAIAAIAPGLISGPADAAVARLVERGAELPLWAPMLRDVELVEASAVTDEFGDDDLILARFRRPDEPDHTLVVGIDHNADDSIQQLGITTHPEIVRGAWEERSSVPFRPVSPEQLAARLERGLAWLLRAEGAGVDDDELDLIPLLEARLNLLPETTERVEIRRPELEPADVTAFVRDILDAPEGGALARRIGAESAKYLLGEVGRVRAGFSDGDVIRWSPVVVELMLAHLLPRYGAFDPDDVEHVPDVLRTIVAHAGGRRGLPPALVGETLTAIDTFEREYHDAMAERASGPAAVLAAAMLDDGVDLADEHAVARWINRFNARPIGERDALLGPALERLRQRS